jgi:hypothetical protein
MLFVTGSRSAEVILASAPPVINLGMLGKIPETYDVRRIVEALIQELVKEDILQRNQIDFIIGKGKPKAAQKNEILSDQSEI